MLCRLTIAAALLSFLALGLPGMVAAQDATASLRTIVVNGDAMVRRAPDEARVSLTVETRARGSRDAQQQNAAATAAVQKQLAAAGFGKDTFRTIAYSLQQEFEYVQGKQVPRGYVARNAFDVRLDDVAKVGDAIDAATSAGTAAVNGIDFDLKDRAGAEREALRLAVADARARADAAAAGAGVSVERIVKIEDHRQSRIEPVRAVTFARAEAPAPQTPVEPGVIEIHAQVTLTASIK